MAFKESAERIFHAGKPFVRRYSRSPRHAIRLWDKDTAAKLANGEEPIVKKKGSKRKGGGGGY